MSIKPRQPFFLFDCAPPATHELSVSRCDFVQGLRPEDCREADAMLGPAWLAGEPVRYRDVAFKLNPEIAIAALKFLHEEPRRRIGVHVAQGAARRHGLDCGVPHYENARTRLRVLWRIEEICYSAEDAARSKGGHRAALVERMAQNDDLMNALEVAR